MRWRQAAPIALALLSCACMGAGARPERYFTVEVVDEATGRGVPLVELRTVHALRYYTDSNGIAAIDEPGLTGLPVHFEVRSHGYEAPADGFGIRGVALTVEPGKSARVRIRRLNIAERLYRITGEGIYRDSLLVGRKAPIRQPLLNARVFGQDSVKNALYQGRLFWVWGDTNQPSHPLGNYHTTSATSALPGRGGLDPGQGVDLEYYTSDSGFTREMARFPGEGPTWLDGLVVLPVGGRERLFAAYGKMRGQLEIYERGLCRFNDDTSRFEPIARFPADAPVFPFGHPAKRREGGVEFIYFGDPFPLVRVRADASALRDLSQYEAYTPLREGSRLQDRHVDRDARGKARYAWRRHTPPVGAEDQEPLIRAGTLLREEALLSLKDPETGKPIVIHRGTVNWNHHRRRFIMIATEIGGTSHLGEVWYAEAERPQGPWRHPRKIVTHDRYTFYNPVHHPEFDQQGGRLIYFEGTYTREFSGHPEPTPRYDYNQIMYRLDLTDPRLGLPALAMSPRP